MPMTSSGHNFIAGPNTSEIAKPTTGARNRYVLHFQRVQNGGAIVLEGREECTKGKDTIVRSQLLWPSSKLKGVDEGGKGGLARLSRWIMKVVF
jgi:hypothetical protein